MKKTEVNLMIENVNNVNGSVKTLSGEISNTDSKKTNGQSATTQTNTPPAPSENKVSLSEEALNLKKISKELADKPEIDMDKVEAIKAQIANGEYKVNYEKLAEKIIKGY